MAEVPTPETCSAEALGMDKITWLELEFRALSVLVESTRAEVAELSNIIRGWDAARNENET